MDEGNLSEVLILHDTTAVEAESKRGKIEEFSNPKKRFLRGILCPFFFGRGIRGSAH
ncbi:MAG: hypothetical protein M9962_11000 [Oligoflexia bacterium]|nr:hypothetical protein [Oligoflexia bacterium]